MAAIVSDWLQDWREPLRHKVRQRLAVAILSGPFAPVLDPPTQITQKFESNWHYAWFEPVRFRIAPKQRVAMAAASGPFAPVLNPNTQIIQNFESRWHQPWSEPVRLYLRKGWKAHEQPAALWYPRLIPKANVTVTLSALDPPVTDVASFGVETDPVPLIDRTALQVSIVEIPAESDGTISLTETE